MVAQNTVTFYSEDFNVSDGGWVSEETVDESESWAYGNSSFAGNTTGHWYVEPYNNYANDMDLSVQSPVLDLSGHTGMDLSFVLRYNTERRYDGAQVLYSIDGGANWTVLGAVGSGTNWYNDRDVDGIANNEDGWSNDNGSWQTSSITLPAALDNQSNVRFRFRFGSDYSVTDDGVAFDDWLIEEGAVTVYSEDFDTNDGGWGGLVIPNGYSWTRGVAVTGNASSHFYTDPYNDYGDKMLVSLTSPAIDFTGVFNSDLSFNMNYDAENGWDGLQMRYSIDGGSTFNLLGAVGDGTNWFNDTDVDAFSNGADGWSGDNTNWAISSITLPDETDNQSDVRFQFLFASDGYTTTDDGVGVDDVTITFDAPFITTNTGDYDVGGTWLGGAIPGANDTLYVDENDNLTLNADQMAAMVVVRDGGVLSLNSSEMDINVANIVLQGTGSVNCGSGTVVYSRNGDQSISSLNYHNLVLKGSGNKTITERTNVASNLTLDNAAITLTTNDNLVLVSTGWSTAGRLTAVPSGATIVGKVEVERWIGATSRLWWHLASPHSDASADEWQMTFPITGDFTGADDLGGSNNASGYWYDETTIDANSGVGWSAFPASMNTETLTVGRGYRMFIRQNGSNPLGNATAHLSGTLNTGVVNIPVSYSTSDPSDTAAAGWCFVGNPYASEIDWDKAGWTKTNVADGIYVWDATGGVYRTYVNGVPLNGGGPIIPSGQAFWVRAIASAPSLQITESVKTTSTGTFSKPGTPANLIYVTINDGENEAEMAIRFSDEATERYDPNYDGYYFGGTNPVNLCTYDEDYVYYAINTLPLNEDIEIPVYLVHPDEIGEYELSFDNLASFSNDPGLKLVDLYLGETIDIYDGMHYQFEYDGAPSSNGASRFVIQKTSPTITSVSSDLEESSSIRIFPNPATKVDQLSVLLPFDSEGTLRLIDLEGRVVYTEEVSSMSVYNLVLEGISTGVYTVNYTTNANDYSERVIIK